MLWLSRRVVAVLARRALLTMMVICTASAPLNAADLFEVLQAAFAEDSVYRQAQFARHRAQADKAVSRAKLLPQLQVYGNRSENTLEVTESESTVFQLGEQDFDTTEFGATLTQPIYRPQQQAMLNRDKALALKAEMELRRAEQMLIVRVVEAYREMLFATQSFALTKAELNVVREQAVLARARWQAGELRHSDVLQAEAQRDLVLADLTQAHSEIDEAQAKLFEITGQYYQALAPIPADTFAIDKQQPVAAWLAQATQSNLELKIQHAALEAAGADVSVEWRGHLPTVDFTAQYQNSDQEGGNIGGRVQEDLSFTVQVTVPIWSSGATHNRVKSAQAARESAREQYQHTLRQIEKDIRRTLAQWHNGERRLHALKQADKSMARVLSAVNEGYAVQTHTLGDVLDARRDQYRVNRDVLQAERELLLARLSLLRLTGRLTQMFR